jgi:hypothetical protein
MIGAIPGDVHEANKRPIRCPSADPAEAVFPDLVPPSGHGVAAVRLDEVDHLLVGDVASPDVGDRVGHRASLPRIADAWPPDFTTA